MKIQKMNKRIKALWIKALEGGGYHQAQGDLKIVIKGQASFCCLGVLTQLYCKEKKLDFGTVAYGYMELPGEVIKWSGLNNENPEVYLSKEKIKKIQKKFGENEVTEGETVTLMDCNDEYDMTFREIAEAIRKNY